MLETRRREIKRWRAPSAAATAILFFFWTSHAAADARTEARAYFRKGMAAITAGKYIEGIADLKKAYELIPHPNVLYNIARGYLEAGDLVQAETHFRAYVEGNPPDKDEVNRILADVEVRLRKNKGEPALAPATPPVTSATDVTKANRATPGVTAPPPTSPPESPGRVTPSPTTPGPATPGPSTTSQIRSEDVFDETIVTASKGAQRPLDAPNSTSIITEQDIRLSGITKIPELLRRLAGVDLMQVTGAQTEVSVRGFNQRLANKTLVLVDGRSVYIDLLGATLWQTLSIGVEDIERIEVVRGPGSALYGADAFSGVINVITKRPGAAANGVRTAVGSAGTTHASLWASGRGDAFDWRLSAGYDYLPRWSREVPEGRADVRTGVSDQRESARTVRADVRMTRSLGKRGVFGAGAGVAKGTLEILGVGPLNDIVLPTFTSTDVTTFVSMDWLDVRAFWNRFTSDSQLNVNYIGQSLLPARADLDVFDSEAVFKAKLDLSDTVQNDLRIGAAYRHKDAQWTYLDSHRIENHYSAFVHDELRLGSSVAIVADHRVDWVPYLGRFEQSPRGALLVHPSALSTVRASIATAFRKPTFLESYLSLPIQLPITGAAQLSEGVRRENPSYSVDKERIVSVEVGYINRHSEYFTIDASAFYNRVSGLIQLASNRAVTVGDWQRLGGQDLQTALFPVAFGGWENQCQAYNVWGGEAGVRTFPSQGVDVHVNYTISSVHQDDSGCSVEALRRVVADQRTSNHKINAGAQLRTALGVDASVDVHYVSPQAWAEQVTNFARQAIEQKRYELDAYSLVNGRIGYRFLRDRADVSVDTFNAFNTRHREHPFGQVVDRRVMVSGTFRF